jgi:diguanylate cyclase (GGDEF)-like protein/PAS domain S-box-containing protein
MEPKILSTAIASNAHSFAPHDAFRQMVEFGPDVMVYVRPDGRCGQVSAASLRVLGRSAGSLIGADLREFVLDADRYLLDDLLTQLAVGEPGVPTAFRFYTIDTEWVWIEACARLLPGDAGAVLSLRDISMRKEEEAVLVEANDLLRRRATLDAVTCLPNRGHFTAAVERELRRAQREETTLALLVIGFDDLGGYNELHGRDAGDLALREIATAIESSLCRPGDSAGRLEGAMLGAVLPTTDLRGAAAVSDRIRLAVAALNLEYNAPEPRRVSVTVSFACSDRNAKADALLREAMCEVEVTRAAFITS